jgi:ubiquinone/menaquinone biosynthesis C-methylase UbiE
MCNRKDRENKALTMIAVLKDFYSGNIENLTVLDIGSSTGIIANALSKNFSKVVVIDIDLPAIEYAANQFRGENIRFSVADSMNLAFKTDQFDVAICAQVYEHVPNAAQLMQEIHRVLKPGGVCYFAASNRIMLVEPHYRLPFLSVLPVPLANCYVRLTDKGNIYYEKHLSFWGLKQLVGKFACVDYTRKIIEDPIRFHADYLLPSGSMKKWLAKLFVRHAYQILPGYVWLLKKVIL